jgi:hypothetical protein
VKYAGLKTPVTSIRGAHVPAVKRFSNRIASGRTREPSERSIANAALGCPVAVIHRKISAVRSTPIVRVLQCFADYKSATSDCRNRKKKVGKPVFGKAASCL